MTTWEEIRDEVAGMLADGQPLEDVITKLEQRKNEMAKANLLKAMDEMKNPKPMTNAELEKKWENTVWDTDVYLDDIDGKEQMTNEEWRKTCSAEEFAEAMTKVVLNIVAWNNDPKPSEVRNVLKVWLKQPHSFE